MPSNHLILHPCFSSCPQSSPASGPTNILGDDFQMTSDSLWQESWFYPRTLKFGAANSPPLEVSRDFTQHPYPLGLMARMARWLVPLPGPAARIFSWGTSLVVLWLRLCAFTVGGMVSTPGRGTKILQASRCGKKINKNKSWYKERESLGKVKKKKGYYKKIHNEEQKTKLLFSEPHLE